jgi:hypothetical protein
MAQAKPTDQLELGPVHNNLAAARHAISLHMLKAAHDKLTSALVVLSTVLAKLRFTCMGLEMGRGRENVRIPYSTLLF